MIYSITILSYIHTFSDAARYDYLIKSLTVINMPNYKLKQKELHEQQLEVIMFSSFSIYNYYK